MYKRYELALLALLPADIYIPEWKLEIHYFFGFSSNASDVDNPIKPLQDILTKKYGFNDRAIFKITAEKEIVPKWQEYLSFIIIEHISYT